MIHAINFFAKHAFHVCYKWHKCFTWAFKATKITSSVVRPSRLCRRQLMTHFLHLNNKQYGKWNYNCVRISWVSEVIHLWNWTVPTIGLIITIISRNFNMQHLTGTVTMAINKSINSKQNSLEQLTQWLKRHIGVSEDGRSKTPSQRPRTIVAQE